ncbi:MAG: short-chain dehydrogenase [SAR86 cluster bacterium]|uniref:Short-chain dehydrogenase n=1 Tax=SAR86 cluster bacterium TaxID=2030880 RepID=A0A2A5CCE0_9GAMM|nr:MAG: short-chain dehydrogenase [SAR86 cluster bacterium]
MSTVLITGANRGIGLELSRQYVESGDRVYACCRKPEAASELNTLAAASKGQLTVHSMDVSSEHSIKACAKELSSESIGILINNAGIIGGDHQTFDDANLEDWLFTFQVNTIGPFRVAQAFQEHLKLADNPKMMTISSQVAASTFSMSGIYAYASSKAAVNKVMQALAVEWQQSKISVGLIHPGWVQTDMGGAEAQITPQASAAGIRQVIENFKLDDTGSFFKWNGEIHPW